MLSLTLRTSMQQIVSPSLLSCDFLNIENEIKCFNTMEDVWFHLDIMDGHFVPNLTFGLPIIKLMPKITSIKLDAHFMVSNPEFHIEDFKYSGIHNFTFHFEATNSPLELIKKAKQYYPSVGISLRPNTPLSVLTDEMLQTLDMVLIMSVEPGFGGQSFIEGTWDKLAELSKRQQTLGTNLMVQVDGGVTNVNSKQLREAGATNLVAGSYIFKDGPSSYLEKVNSLK